NVTTVCSQEDLTSSTLNPEPSPPSPRGAEHKPVPTDDREPVPTAADEPSHLGTTKLRIAEEPELHKMADQVQKLATTLTARKETVA
ncbi:hypothetical protein M9458_028807, partial [Cirrhinus mrigala]